MDLYLTNIYLDVVAKLLIASILGAVVGLEREVHGRAAGVRTHLLVSLGASVFMMLSPIMAASTSGSLRAGDAGRIAAQVVTGIGFLGAGAIIKQGSMIKGLTTAASLWIAAAIGMSCGSGNYFIAVIATATTLFALLILPKFSKNVAKEPYHKSITFTVNSMENINKSIIDFFTSRNIHISEYNIEIDHKKATTQYTILIAEKKNDPQLPYDIIEFFKTMHVSIKNIDMGNKTDIM